MSSKVRILLLEDSESDAELLVRELRRGGYTPDTLRVQDESAFVSALAKEDWDLIISDYSLPQFDARAALARLQESGRDVPFIIVSGVVGEEVAVAAMKAGAQDYLRKDSLARLNPAVARELREGQVRHERRRALETNSRLAAIVESSGDAIIGTTLEGVITSWNRGAEKLFGYTQREVCGLSTMILLPTDRVTEELEIVRRLRRGETIQPFETVRLRKDGSHIDVSVAISPIQDEDGVVIGASKIARDITEHKRAQNYIAALSKLGQNLSTSTTPGEAAYVIGIAADQLFDWDYFSLDLFNAIENRVRTVLCVDTANGLRRELTEAYTSKPLSDWDRHVMQFGPELKDCAPQPDSNAPPVWIMSVPVRSQANTVGLLHLRCYRAQAYQQRDLSTLQTLADYCGGALERISMREELRASEERFQRVLQSDLIGIHFWEDSGHIIDANEKFLALVGYTREELRRGLLHLDVLATPESRAQNQFIRSELLAHGICPPTEKEYLRKDGSRVPVMVGALRLPGRELRGVSYVLDITERKLAMEALRKSEERYRKLSESAPLGIFECDPFGNCSYTNSRWTTISGLTLVESLGQGWLKAVHPDDLDQLLEGWRSAESAGCDWVHEHRLVPNERKIHWVRTHFARVRDAQGKHAGYVGTIEDITQNKRAMDEVRSAQERLQSVLERMPIGCMLTDTQGRLTFFNAAAESIFGYSFAELHECNLLEFLVAPGARAETQSRLDRILKGEAHADGITENLTRDGRTILCDWKNTSLRRPDGGIVGIISMCQDVTAQKRAEIDLRSSREALRALAAHLQSVREEERKRIAREIHDELGQSLTGFKMDLAWIRNRLQVEDGPLERKPLIAKIAEMGQMLDGMAVLMRKLCTELRPGVLDDLGLMAAIEWQAREYRNRTGIQCDLKLEAGELPVDPDRSTALFRIFQEILTNVARHAQASRVEVHMRRVDSHLHLEVRDNGRGISEAEKAGAKSLGLLGLRERAVILGGAVEIEGVAGSGTTVRVRMPLPETETGERIEPGNGSRARMAPGNGN